MNRTKESYEQGDLNCLIKKCYKLFLFYFENKYLKLSESMFCDTKLNWFLSDLKIF
jgi:hypothetical protein